MSTLAPAIFKKTFGGSYLALHDRAGTFWRELLEKKILREFLKKYFAGTFKAHLAGKISKTHLAGANRHTDIDRYSHIFGPDSGISSHSFGRSYCPRYRQKTLSKSMTATMTT